MASCHIVNHIRKFRFNANEMTQQDLATKIGVTRQTVLAIEAGKYSPTLELAFKISQVFAARLEEVFQYDADAS